MVEYNGMDIANRASTWRIPVKVFFRFFLIYAILYVFPFPFGWIPGTEPITEAYNHAWLEPVHWTGKNFFHLPYDITVMPNGSGDTTYNYVQVFLFFLLALTGSVVWSIVDRKKENYDVLLYWLTVFLRYYLAVTMLQYGFAKVIKTQFPFPYLPRLFQPYGESSPMGLLWTFMGYSTAYNIFTGLGEVLGGFFLFFKRTKLLGALLVIVVMSNVVMLNFSYDVPVKLFSLHLLVIALFLMAPDAHRLYKFFILNEPVEKENLIPVYRGRKSKISYLILKSLFIGWILVAYTLQGLEMQKTWGDTAPRPVLYGVYDVETFVLRQDTLPPVLGDTRRWRRLFINNENHAHVEYMDGAQIGWRYAGDTLQRTLQLWSYDSATSYHFTYFKRMNNRLFLKGNIAGDPIELLVKTKDPGEFMLVNRGFHWVNEYPFNR